jgi:mannosyltransferase OCH1-like enzyme
MIIHQTARYEITDLWELNNTKTLKELYPKAKYIFWNDESLKKLAIDKFPKINAIWKNLLGIQIADIGRIMVLFIYGGMYVDTDVEWNRCIDENMLKNNDILFAPSVPTLPYCEPGITNYIIYVKKSFHPFLTILLNNMIEKCNDPLLKILPMFIRVPSTTGRTIIMSTIKQWKKNKQNTDKINCFDDEVKNIFSPFFITKTSYACAHIGSTTRAIKNHKSTNWNNNYSYNVVLIECIIRKYLKIQGNICQAPVCIIFIINFIIIALYKIYKLKIKKQKLIK